MNVSRFLWPCYLLSASAFGDGANVATLHKSALERSTGITEINIASGNSSAQSNGVAIAVSRGGPAIAHVASEQIIEEESGDDSENHALSLIESGAISNSTGIVMLNQSSGEGNAQINGIAIALGIEGDAIADNELDQSVSNPELSSGGLDAPDATHSLSMEAGAIQNGQGVIQVNQAAGSWNATANSFALRISGAANP